MPKLIAAMLGLLLWLPAVAAANDPGDRQALFGDLHVHTKYSFDAFIFGTRADPDDAYKFAKGEPLNHPAGFQMQLKSPLDFQAVTDHATYLGMLLEMDDPDSSVGQHPLAIAMRQASTPEERDAVFQEILPRERGFIDFEDDLLDMNVVRSAWASIIEAAERHNQPGEFTTFIGYEFTAGGRRGQNLHRNVIFRSADVPEVPYSRLDADNDPEQLWDWMDRLRARDMEALAIPHNSNGSDGWMFELTDNSGNPIDAQYAEQRMRNEPVVEVTQVKGTSETHPLLSPNDEWADFEIMNYTIGTSFLGRPEGSYVRQAYLDGLKMEETRGVNPYRFGLIGSSDTHNAGGSFREDDYWSKTGMLDATPELRGSVPQSETNAYADPIRRFWSASGLAAVWSDANSRDAIFEAFQRKETFATTGPRIRVRFFGGYDFDDRMVSRSSAVDEAYANGVSMGGELSASAKNKAPRFFLWAVQDPSTAPLERAQVIKGWIEDGRKVEKVYDVACSDGAKPAETLHRCPDNGAQVDITTCSYSDDVGASELKTIWQDPDFDPDQRAFYYTRVLQNPTCRWSTWDAIRAGHRPRPDLPATIQERAWSSPIWFDPA